MSSPKSLPLKTSIASVLATLRLGQIRPALMAPALLAFGLAAQTADAQDTGFNQAAAGPWDYLATENWVDGSINGIWDSSLTLSAAQTVTFATDAVLTNGLNIGYTGNVDLTLRSDGFFDRTVTLGGDIYVNPVSNRTLTIGSFTGSQGLSVDLGGVSRTFSVGSAKTLTFMNTVSNGDFTITGGGTVRLARFAGAAETSDIEVNSNSTLMFDSSTSGIIGMTRAQSVTLKSGGKLEVRGNNGVNSVDTVSGAVVIDGSAARVRSGSDSISNITVTPGNQHTLLSIGSLERATNAVVLFRGSNLGSDLIDNATGGSGNIQIGGTAPTLVGGGGAAGSTKISIMPWAVGGTSSSDTGTTFVTYTAANGIRPLDIATEFASEFSDATDNVRLTTPTVLDTDATANSLILGDAGATLSGTGTLTVTSGAVFMTRTTGASSNISAGLNFGSAEGIIGYRRGDTISGPIAGSGGLTIYGMRTDEAMIFTNAESTYTGDTVILANAQVAAGFLPHGSRTGDVHVYGNLQLRVSGYNGTINGLFGNGTVAYGNSGASSLAIGDNDTSSLFTGTIAGNSNLSISKIGSGTLTFTRDHTYSKITSILGGTLSVATLADGGIASGVGQSSSAASNLVINGGTLRYTGAATSTDRLFQVGQSTTGGTATLDASGTGAVHFTNTGNITYGTTGTGANEQTRTLVLTGTNTGDNTLSAVIADNGISPVTVEKEGTGTWVLAGDNTYTGPTNINAGTLLVSGSLSGASAVAVNSTATLGGDGSVGEVTVNLGGTVAPGVGAGILEATKLTLETGSTYAFQGGDLIDINGTLDLNEEWKLSLGTGFADGGSVVLFTYDTLAGSPDLTPVFDLTLLGFTPSSALSLTDTGNSIVLNGIQAIPEPASVTLLIGGAGMLACGRRFRGRRSLPSA